MRGTVPAIYNENRIVQKPIPIVELEMDAEAGEVNIVNLEASAAIDGLSQQTTDSVIGQNEIPAVGGTVEITYAAEAICEREDNVANPQGNTEIDGFSQRPTDSVVGQSEIDVVDEVEKITNATEEEENIANPQENAEIDVVGDQNRLDDENCIKNEVIISRTAHAEIDNILSQCTVAVVGSTCVGNVLLPEIDGNELITTGTTCHITTNDMAPNVADADRLNTNAENVIANETTSAEDAEEHVINFYDSDDEAITMAFTGKVPNSETISSDSKKLRET